MPMANEFLELTKSLETDGEAINKSSLVILVIRFISNASGI